MNAEKNRNGMLVAIAMVGCVFTGVAALVGALFAFMNVDPVGFGVSLLAGAVSFGLLAISLLRD